MLAPLAYRSFLLPERGSLAERVIARDRSRERASKTDAVHAENTCVYVCVHVRMCAAVARPMRRAKKLLAARRARRDSRTCAASFSVRSVSNVTSRVKTGLPSLDLRPANRFPIVANGDSRHARGCLEITPVVIRRDLLDEARSGPLRAASPRKNRTLNARRTATRMLHISLRVESSRAPKPRALLLPPADERSCILRA